MSSPPICGLRFPPGLLPSVPQALHLDFSRPVSPGCPTESDFTRHGRSRHRRIRTMTRTRTMPPPTLSSRRHTYNNEPNAVDHAQRSSISEVHPGMYIAFSLTSNDGCQPLPIGATEGTGDIRVSAQRYIGLVTDVNNITKIGEDHESQEVTVLTVSYASNGPVPEYSRLFADHWLSISPACLHEDSGPVPPLDTTVLFPFMGTKQWTTLGTRLEVAHLHHSSLSFALNNADYGRFEEISTSQLETLVLQEAALPRDSEQHIIHGKVLIPEEPVPAEIWTDIRVAGQVNAPTYYLEEVAELTGESRWPSILDL